MGYQLSNSEKKLIINLDAFRALAKMSNEEMIREVEKLDLEASMKQTLIQKLKKAMDQCEKNRDDYPEISPLPSQEDVEQEINQQEEVMERLGIRPARSAGDNSHTRQEVQHNAR